MTNTPDLFDGPVPSRQELLSAVDELVTETAEAQDFIDLIETGAKPVDFEDVNFNTIVPVTLAMDVLNRDGERLVSENLMRVETCLDMLEVVLRHTQLLHTLKSIPRYVESEREERDSNIKTNLLTNDVARDKLMEKFVSTADQITASNGWESGFREECNKRLSFIDDQFKKIESGSTMAQSLEKFLGEEGIQIRLGNCGLNFAIAALNVSAFQIVTLHSRAIDHALLRFCAQAQPGSLNADKLKQDFEALHAACTSVTDKARLNATSAKNLIEEAYDMREGKGFKFLTFNAAL